MQIWENKRERDGVGGWDLAHVYYDWRWLAARWPTPAHLSPPPPPGEGADNPRTGAEANVSPHMCLNVPGLRGDLIETFKLTRMWFVFPTAPTRREAQADDDLGTLRSSPTSRAPRIHRFMRTEASFRSPSASFVVNGPFVLNGNGGSDAENSPSASDGKWIGSDSPP